ncbi:MAG: thiamine phosphate synthase [Aureispira sp.]|nr:thiamine phosphate synthase [Aureispira sp.]
MHIRLLTTDHSLPNEAKLLNQLFESGLECLHLRKPTFSAEEYTQLLDAIDEQYYNKIITHTFFELVEVYGLKGIHLREAHRESLPKKELDAMIANVHDQGWVLGSSVHHPNTLAQLPQTMDYVFVSPVFESISKKGYKPSVHWDINDLKKQYPFQLIGLGGIAADKIEEAQLRGFEELAVLGSIWNDLDKAVDNFQQLLEYS